jgi:ATP-dependent DNA helicase RecG
VGSLSGKRVGALVTQALDRLSRGEPIEVVPKELLETFSVPVLTEALERVHRPAPGDDLDALNSRISPAHRRLALGELYEDQLELAAAYMRHRNRVKGRGYRLDDHLRQVARELLPFRLTMAQKRVVGEMVRDLTSPYPMLRLLQGDVGSGKTVVAALLMLVAAENGVQSTLLAPTQLLAEQHATTLRELFGERMPVLLLTAKGRGDEAHPTVSLQEAPVVVGTHALLSSTLELPRLGLVIIDEQHRFGVTQRQAMVEKGRAVDLLVMSATPIPRTLALAGYGDLDLSLLDEMPPGRRPVETLVVPRKQRKEVYSRLREELRLGRQGYVVFPSIRPRETGKWASLEGMAPKIEAGLEGVSVERFHGQLAWEEREEVMRRFRSGDVQLLLATTVVEVGVDVPAATVMIIEGAERFGLAQLHQLRGRVGRGREESWCAAIHGTLTPEAELRLQAFAAHQDGFSIAEHDLKIRGQGELLGERQAGMMSFRVADLERDADLLEGARVAARRTVTKVFETLKWDRDEGGDQWFVS